MQWILNDIPLGRNIQNIRIERNMTQAEVVAKMQIMENFLRIDNSV